MFFSRALALSGLVHALLLLALFLYKKSHSDARPPVAVFVDLPAAKEMEAAGAAGAAGGRAGQRVGRTLKPLPRGWTWKSGVTGGAIGKSQTTGAAAGKGEAVHKFAQGMGVEQEAKFFGRAEDLYRRIDSFLGYPDDFVEENISGSVTVHALVDEAGRFVKFLEAEGDEAILRTYVMAMVAMALREPSTHLPAPTPIAVRVDFRLLLPDEYGRRDLAPHFKNTLQYERLGFTDAKAIKVVRRAIEKYIPPIIPLPGGVYVDFVLLYKRINELDGNDEKWRRSVRMDLDREQMEIFLKKH